MLAQAHGEPQNSDSFRKLCCGCVRKLSARKAKKKKSVFWGIEVAETLRWHGWELGKEMIKHLILKNVHEKTQKLSYRCPSTRFFFTVFPQPITLSPGMSLTLPIIFRPTEKREYEDSIYFKKAEGEFSVTLRATLPCPWLSFPAAVQLPICAVHNVTETTFPVRNIGDCVTVFAWETPSPFYVIPDCGMLNPGAECVVKVVFQPKVAAVYDVAATCWFGGEEKQKRTIQLKALAKYPYLRVRVTEEESEGVQPGKFRDVLCFGSVPVGTTAEKCVEILNMSVVDAPCRIERAKDPLLQDHVFSCDVSHGVVPAKGKLVLCIRFQPQTVGEHSTDYFTIVSAGCLLQTVLKVVGLCKGPLVSLHQYSVDFDWINLGESLMQTLKISNISDVSAYYQFDIDGRGSVFSLDRPCGVLEGTTTLALKVTFRPTHPISYHRRVVCLVHHQEPMYVDFFGTCHSDTDKPAILQARHLSWYRTNMVRGLTFYPPDILSAMLKDGKLQMDEKGALMLPPEIPQDKPPNEYLEANSMTEYFYDGVSSDLALFPPHVSVSHREYDFGCCVPLHKVEPLPLCVTNHTKGKITVVWTPNDSSAFQVNPKICDIPPLKSSAFRVLFQPTQLNSLYAAQLEGFAFYKVLRHYSNIEEDATICPSWCLTVSLRAHTYEAEREHFIPQYILDVPKTFPPVAPNTDTYCSMLLLNTGNSLITFSVNQAACPSVLLKPRSGHVIPGGHQIFFLSTHPVNTVSQQHVLPLQLNSCPGYTKEIALQSSGESLLLLLEDDGNLYFKPVHIGTSSTRMYTIKNCTRLPMVFTWKIHQSDSKILSVSPTSGILQPCEAMAQAWTFSPDKETKYLLRAMVFVRRKSPDPMSPKSVRYALRIVGEGVLGTIRAQKEHLDLGNVLVGDLQSCSIVLLNDGICSLKYVLSVEQRITRPCDPEEVLSDPLALELEHSRGTIPARSKAFVRITVRPARRLHYTWSIKYAICTPTATDLASAREEQQPLCCIVATGIYPTICIADACSAGSASGISKLHLWRLFSLDTLNEYLDRDPAPSELTYRVPTRHSTCLIPPVYTSLLLDFNFGAAPIGSEPTLVMLLLANKGVVPVEWAFLFPSDQKIDMEHWAEDAEFSPHELHQMRIQDNHLFSVSPKSGKLLPGQEESVQLSHRHDFIGTDHLPVLLKVSYGHEILLNFSGVTVEQDQCYIHFASTKHLFTPIAIGTSHPPIQIYELYNGGSVPVTFEVQLDNIVRIQEENFQHPVFVCLTPRGEILPGTTGHIEWIFSPLEAGTYLVDVPIHILGGESALITFQGVGYDPNTVEESATSSEVLPSSDFSGSTKLTVPGQAATLSHHRICLGNIPEGTKASRLVFLNSISESKAVVFAWRISTCKDKRVLEIAPESGVVQPGESIPCFITLRPSGSASFYSINLVCEVYIQESLVQYKRDLQEWEREKERQAVEFTITDKDLGSKKKPKSSAGRSSDSAETENLPESPAVIRKYKTLPPIKNHSTPDLPAGHFQRRLLLDKEASRVWVKPDPPKPILLHLGVTARSYSIEDFFSDFTAEFPKCFLSRPFSDQPLENKFVDGSRDRDMMDMDPKWLSLAAASKQELQIVTDTLTGVIRGLLENTQFHDAVRRTLDEPIPYFSQFHCEESVELQDRRQCSTVPSRVPASPDLCPEKDGERKEMRQETSPNNDLLESWERMRETLHHEQLREQELMSRQPAFGNLVELVLENTLQNILIEASRGEVVLTARPRVIALPPSPFRRVTNPAPPPSRA
ncbi:cilia- and flagella-associated protein 65 isoform X1 [Grus americana]|uniref:cilia- and flagella-associated protein 65 isoform X1 n=2 Tax=Grus americana TaxID=9117 RepID=UPI0024079A03|nr:cilia- and flagella-associated protein 65 isoform X1 [Grus americana]XP_054686604.1 cilia- and flagella-associated protein 65 isoform X1 [Grus americana]